jgi:hypothetical protein
VKTEAFPARSLRLMCQFASQARLHSDPNLQIGLCQIGPLRRERTRFNADHQADIARQAVPSENYSA